jgi:hypothetical protein
MRIRALIVGAVLAGAAALADFVLQRETDFPRFLLLAIVLLLLAYPVLIGPGRRYARWGYAMDGEDLRIAHGVWTHTETLVPLSRVQHLDVSQGPLERGFGVCRLVLHTAGTMHSRVVLPGLARATAEAMRDEIRARLREEGA